MLSLRMWSVHPRRAETPGLRVGVGVGECGTPPSPRGMRRSPSSLAWAWELEGAGGGTADPVACVGAGLEPEAVWCSLIEYRARSIPRGHARVGREGSEISPWTWKLRTPQPGGPPCGSLHPAHVVCKRGRQLWGAGDRISQLPCKYCLYELGFPSFVSGSSLINQQITAAFF